MSQEHPKSNATTVAAIIVVCLALGLGGFLYWRGDRQHGEGWGKLGLMDAENSPAAQTYMDQMVRDYEQWLQRNGFVRLSASEIASLPPPTFHTPPSSTAVLTFGTWRGELKDGTEFFVQPHLSGIGSTGLLSIEVQDFFRSDIYHWRGGTDWRGRTAWDREKAHAAELDHASEFSFQWKRDYRIKNPATFKVIAP